MAATRSQGASYGPCIGAPGCDFGCTGRASRASRISFFQIGRRWYSCTAASGTPTPIANCFAYQPPARTSGEKSSNQTVDEMRARFLNSPFFPGGLVLSGNAPCAKTPRRQHPNCFRGCKATPPQPQNSAGLGAKYAKTRYIASRIELLESMAPVLSDNRSLW